MTGRFTVWMILALFCSLDAPASPAPSGPRFEVSIPRSVNDKPITGRLLLMISKQKDPDPRFQAGPLLPMFGTEVSALIPGQIAIIDGKAEGTVFACLDALPAGDYYVQAL